MSKPPVKQVAPEIRVFAPAKINWNLTIERRRADGFHDIQTVFQALSWGDELRCRPLAKPVCRISCGDPAVPTGADNLIAKAWRLLRETCPGHVGGVVVELLKRVPMGAGLGGGSSDGAATLVALRRLYGLKLTGEKLVALAARLGSDCAFFIRGGTAAGAGRGERLTPLRNRLARVWLVVVVPDFHSSTAAAYARIGRRDWENGTANERVIGAIERGDLPALRAASRNIFGETVAAADARYQLLSGRMRKEGLTYPLLSGSGSAIFAHARDARHAHEACQRLGQDYPVAVAARLRRTGAGVLRSTLMDSR